MGFLLEKCSFSILDEAAIESCAPFCCGNSDLDEFFQHDAPLYSKQLLGKTYCFRLEEDPSTIVCAFTLSNDSLRAYDLPNSREKKIERRIPYAKQMRRYPGVLIGRLGINIQFKHQGIGTELMTFIKSWFLDSANKTGCRFLIVDAYNDSIPIDYYLKNGFKFLFSTEEQEAKYTNINILPIRTRLMYFDLMELI
jgi:hypothetical protein